jgi:hypothetical protein
VYSSRAIRRIFRMRKFGMTEGAIKVAVLRLRQRYRELFRAEIANTVAATEDVDEELRHVIAILM